MARIIIEKDIEIPMRDGCVLKGDLYRPDSNEKLPVLLNRTPYDKKFPLISSLTLDSIRAAQRGYNVVFVDCRGRFASQGTFTCFVDEPRDGYDTIEWLARQPFADGKVGMFGASYMGATQWLAATQAPPSLKAMVPSITASDYHNGWTYQGGAFALYFNVSWTMISLGLARLIREREENPAASEELATVMESIDHMCDRMDFMPLREFPMFRAGAPYFFDWLEHPYYDDYWRKLCIEEYSPVSVDLDGMQLDFFDGWLKGKQNGAAAGAPVRIYVMGLNQWREEKEWPLPGTEWRHYYLHSRGRANSAYGDGALSTGAPGSEPPDSFLYNPLDPVPTRGGGLCCYANALAGGAFDQSMVEHRADVLVYSTEPLAENVEVTGPITLTLYASSSASDTDFTGKLVDVDPNGFARNLTDGIIRARVRESQSEPKLINPGKVYEFTLDMWSTSNLFKAGHRIRLEVSSSNFPRFDRNPNTGHELFVDAETRPALQTVMHERGFGSYVTLPVIPERR